MARPSAYLTEAKRQELADAKAARQRVADAGQRVALIGQVTAAKIKAANRERDEAITEAYRAGVRVDDIAAAVGLTRGRIYQILNPPPS